MADNRQPFQYGPVVSRGFGRASPFGRMDSVDSDLDELGKPLELPPVTASQPLDTSCSSDSSMASETTKSCVSSAQVSKMPDGLIRHVVWSMDRCSRSNFLDAEFKRIHDFDGRYYSHQKKDASKLPQNIQKNRYLNVLSYDEWRVKLHEIPGVIGSDYINASWITDIEGDEAKDKHRFIATQGPMTDYLQDFWRMIWENSVNIIVFLGKEIEKGYRKVDRYWPDGDSKNSLSQNPWDKNRFDSFFSSFNQPEVHKKDMVLPPFTIEALKEEVVQDCEIVKRTFRLKNSNFPDKERVVYQFQYGGWPDQGSPASSHDVRTLINEIRTLHDKDEKPGPIVVHCSAGIGRTGAFCTIYVYIQNILMYMDRMEPDELEKVKRESRRKAEANDSESSPHQDRDYGPDVLSFNISATVLSLRRRRVGMVQNPDQYKFCYKAIVDELREQEFLPPPKDLPEPTFESEATSSNSVIPVLEVNANYVEDLERTRFSSSSSLMTSSGFGSLSVASQIRQLSKNPKPAEKTSSRPLSMTSPTGNPLLSGSTGVRCGSDFGSDSDNDDFQLTLDFGRSPPQGFSKVSRQVHLPQEYDKSSTNIAGDLVRMDDDDDDVFSCNPVPPNSFSDFSRSSSSSSEFK